MDGNKIEVIDSTLPEAAALAERAFELLDIGWVQGQFFSSDGGVVPTFCIEGAIALAERELHGFLAHRAVAVTGPADVLRKFIMDEALSQQGEKFISVPAFNDRSGRSKDEVLSVVRSAADRLWRLAVDTDGIDFGATAADMSKYSDDVTEERAQQYLHAALA